MDIDSILLYSCLVETNFYHCLLLTTTMPFVVFALLGGTHTFAKTRNGTSEEETYARYRTSTGRWHSSSLSLCTLRCRSQCSKRSSATIWTTASTTFALTTAYPVGLMSTLDMWRMQASWCWYMRRSTTKVHPNFLRLLT